MKRTRPSICHDGDFDLSISQDLLLLTTVAMFAVGRFHSLFTRGIWFCGYAYPWCAYDGFSPSALNRRWRPSHDGTALIPC